MTAYESAKYYMLGVVFCEVCFVATVLSDRPYRWFEFCAMLAVVGPMLKGWREAA